MKRLPRPWVFASLGVLLAVGGFIWVTKIVPQGESEERYRIQALERGQIIHSVAANGTLNPVEMVAIGTQVSGTVRALHADFNDKVQAGSLLAQLDPSLLEARLSELAANLQQSQSQLQLARIKLRRTEELHARGMIAASQIDEARASERAAHAATQAIQAQIQREKTNLRYTRIVSPIDGIVVSRSVEKGQTVAASFQTPTLFQIARDLNEMQIDTNVAEADVGHIRVGQKAEFTVDAYPGQTFQAKVHQVRLNPAIAQNVVTYNVVLRTHNPDGKLFPGMTAQTKIVLTTRDGVLRIPAAALRYRPELTENTEKSSEKNTGAAPSNQGSRGIAAGEATREKTGSEKRGKRATDQANVFRLNADNQPEKISVRIGIADASYVELMDEGKTSLSEGDRLIVGEKENKKEKGKNFNLRF